MLIEFTVGNFLSIKDRQTLRMDAASISEHKDQLIDAGRYKLLRSAVIYGANASGKSNVLRAIAAMRHIVETSAEQSSKTPLLVYPFRLSTETENSPSYFEVLMIIGNIRYRYGFEADRKSIHSEWLFKAEKKQERTLFLRVADGIDVSKEFKEGKGLEEKTRDNALFLSVCDQFNGAVAKSLISWFSRITTLSGLDVVGHRPETEAFLFSDNERIVAFLGALYLGFDEIHINDNGTDDALTRVDIKTVHDKYDSSKKIIGKEMFNLDVDESEGTKKIFDIVGPIFQVLDYGGVLVIDELDARLHPILIQSVVRLFNDPESNTNNAQLIFSTHDTNLLTTSNFRRDQVYFTEKDQYGSTSLYSLVEYMEEDGGKIRKDRSFEKDYLQGRYGAIPFIGDLSKLVPAWQG